MCRKTSHYIVIRSPFAEEISTGRKTREYRPLRIARMLSGKTVGISVARNPLVPTSCQVICVVTFGGVGVAGTGEPVPEGYPTTYVEILDVQRLKEPVPVSGGQGLRRWEYALKL